MNHLTLGGSGGAETETLTAGQIPEITSSVQVSVSGGVSVNTLIGIGGVNASANNTTALNGIGPQTNFPGSGSFSGSGSGAAQSNNTGGGAHPNVQPTILCNYVIRVL
jgi:microcystin-dependent protein